MQSAQGEQSGAAEGSYEQAAAAVEEGKEMEREDERGEQQRPQHHQWPS
jgi:hypothetical protein